MQVPGLIVLLYAFPAEDGLVVYLDELPFRAVAEVSEKTTETSNKLLENSSTLRTNHSLLLVPQTLSVLIITLYLNQSNAEI